MQYLGIWLAVLLSGSAALADETPPPPPVNMDKLLQDLRDLDTSTDMQGDHVVGETLC